MYELPAVISKAHVMFPWQDKQIEITIKKSKWLAIQSSIIRKLVHIKIGYMTVWKDACISNCLVI